MTGRQIMRGVLICLVLALSTGAAIADRPVTQQESTQLEAALKEQGCSGGKMEFDDGKFEVDKGAWYGNNHYSHATTYTGVGHATLLSCAHPYKHGVVGNDWIDKKTGRRLYSTEDARFKYLDEETPDHSGTSPFNMKVTTVGDELIYANGKST